MGGNFINNTWVMGDGVWVIETLWMMVRLEKEKLLLVGFVQV